MATYRQVAQLVAAALPNESRSVWATMTAIARCESGLNPQSYNPAATNSPAFGLWQQNEGAGRALFDPQTAARHMAATYHASRYRYWGCGPDHRAGYLLFLGPATAAVATLPSGGGSGGTGGGGNLAKQHHLTPAQSWAARGTWMRCFRKSPGDLPTCKVAAIAACVKRGGSGTNCAAYIDAWAQRSVANATAGACINSLTFAPIGGLHLGSVGQLNICLDTIIGGAKVAAGGLLMVVGGMAVIFVLSRDVPGATAVTRAVAKATPTGAYKSLRRSVKVRGTNRESYRRGVGAGRERVEREQRAEFNRAERRGEFPAEEPEGFNTRRQLAEGRRRASPKVRDRVGSRA